jgi:hypothetical protein
MSKPMFKFTILLMVGGLSGCDDFLKALAGDEATSGMCSAVEFEAEDAAEEGLERTNFYRDLVGLNPGVLDSALTDAAQTHAAYMYYIGAITHQQEPSGDCYSGAWVWDRMEAAGFPLEAGNSWSEVVAFGFGPAGSVDGWVDTVYHRIPFVTPRWSGIGFGQAEDFASMNFVADYPAGVNQVIVFPIDGQTGVPTSFDSDTEIPDPAPSHGVVGYPITVTVAADNVSGSDTNPYGLTLLSGSLVGPSGAVNVIMADPDDDAWLGATAFMLPTEPLQAGAEYEVEMTIIWNGIEETIYSVFTTAG